MSDTVDKARAWDAIAEKNAEIADLKRLIWVMVASSGGYVLQKGDFEMWPGAERALLVRRTDDDGDVILEAFIAGQQSGDCGK